MDHPGRVEVVDVVVETHPELAVRTELHVQLTAIHIRHTLPLHGIVRPRPAPLAVTLTPRVAQSQQLDHISSLRLNLAAFNYLLVQYVPRMKMSLCR